MVTSFLSDQFLAGASYSTLNSQYSALALVFSVNSTNKDFLKRFLKGIYKQRPPKPRYDITWDPNPVLSYLSSLFPLSEISVTDLTVKLVTLLALITGHRIQTLAKIQLRNITLFNDRLEIKISDGIKTSNPKRVQPLLVIPYFKENPSLCLASVIEIYIRRTENVRPTNNDYLILTIKKPVHPASSQRISKWIKNGLQAGGIDLTQFSSYSTRHAATSAACRAGVSIETIRKAAGWTDKSNTFNKFYNRPLCYDPTSFAKGVLTSFIRK